MANLNLYIDPGTGSMLFTVLIGVLSAAVYGARTLFIRLRTGAGRKADKNKIPLVIYSDNKRYWNTFEPICDELEKRGQDAVFMTASPDDPALKKEYKHIKTVVIDTINGVMVAEEMRNAKVNGFGKWTDLAQYVWSIFDYCLTMRDDLNVIILAHAITDTDDNGVVFTHIRTNGRKLEKIVLESKLTTVLLAVCKDGKYVFKTRSDRSSVKTPLGAFDDDEIDNDITLVIKALEEF